jgi:hypothetical protein
MKMNIDKKKKEKKVYRYKVKYFVGPHDIHMQQTYSLKEICRGVKFYAKGGHNGNGFMKIEILDILNKNYKNSE